MGLKARASTKDSKSKGPGRGRPARRTARRVSIAGSGDVGVLDMSLADASGVRELRDQLGAPAGRGDDSEHGFADPSLVVRLQKDGGREELEPPDRRRSQSQAEDEAVSLFDMPAPRSQPPPEDGSLFGRVKRARLRRRR